MTGAISFQSSPKVLKVNKRSQHCNPKNFHLGFSYSLKVLLRYWRRQKCGAQRPGNLFTDRLYAHREHIDNSRQRAYDIHGLCWQVFLSVAKDPVDVLPIGELSFDV